MKIESPLEVLSRAASIVQNEDKPPVSSTDTKLSQGKNRTEEINFICNSVYKNYNFIFCSTLSFQLNY